MIANMLAIHSRVFHRQPRHTASVWALVITLLITYGFGINRHIHVPGSDAAGADHAHQAEIHLEHGNSLIDNTPNEHDDTDWVLLDLDELGITKKAPGSDVALVLFGALLLLYLLFPTEGRRLPLFVVTTSKRKTYHSVFPPTRAPPR